mgnify:CR=1 FL=1
MRQSAKTVGLRLGLVSAVLASCLLLIGGDLLGAWVDDDLATIAVDDK